MSNRALNAAWASDVKGAARMVLLVLADYADDSDTAWPGYEAIAKKANKAPERCMKLVKELVKAGAITVEWGAGPNGVNIYHLDPIMPAVQGGDDLESKVEQKCSKSESEMVPESSPNPLVTPGTPELDAFPSVKHLRRSPKRATPQEPSPELAECLEHWRASGLGPVSQRATTGLKALIATHGAAMVKRGISRCAETGISGPVAWMNVTLPAWERKERQHEPTQRPDKPTGEPVAALVGGSWARIARLC